jgi:hypothetical protein
MLGEVDSAVVAAAMGWFNPDLVNAMYEEGTSVAGATTAADRMFEAHALWGRDHLSELELAGFVELAGRLVDGASGGGLPLFVAWRSHARVEDVPGRAAQLLQVLREWRGANHLVATTGVGLSPLEAILTNEGEGQASFFGWQEPFADVSNVRHLHDEAEATTDRLCAKEIEALLAPAEREDFVEAVTRIRSTLP